VDLSFDRLHYDGLYPYAADAPGAPTLVEHDFAVGQRVGAGGHVTRPVFGRQTLTAGGEFFANITQNQGDTFSDASVANVRLDHSSHQEAAYLQDEIRVRPWLLLSGGVRYDRYDRFSKTTPHAAVVVMPSANDSFKYLYGRAFRAPNAYELYYFNADAPSYLRPESIDTHEVVWERYVGEWLRTSVSAYHYTASDLITFDVLQPDTLLPVYGVFNDGIVKARGLELEGEIRTKRGVQMLASYARQHAENNDGTPLTNSPGTMGKLRVSAPVPFAHSVGALELQYLSPRRTLAANTVPSATLVNATFNARLSPSVELLGTIDNLFDQHYWDPGSDEHLSDAIQQNGRTLRVGLRWNLWRPRS
jgi:outer membrane receptor for ferrienterochelin and colicins